MAAFRDVIGHTDSRSVLSGQSMLKILFVIFLTSHILVGLIARSTSLVGFCIKRLKVPLGLLDDACLSNEVCCAEIPR